MVSLWCLYPLVNIIQQIDTNQLKIILFDQLNNQFRFRFTNIQLIFRKIWINIKQIYIFFYF
ncbi:hypothetical protein pb186bvf_002647 [Paramecium bursaria]